MKIGQYKTNQFLSILMFHDKLQTQKVLIFFIILIGINILPGCHDSEFEGYEEYKGEYNTKLTLIEYYVEYEIPLLTDIDLNNIRVIKDKSDQDAFNTDLLAGQQNQGIVDWLDVQYLNLSSFDIYDYFLISTDLSWCGGHIELDYVEQDTKEILFIFKKYHERGDFVCPAYIEPYRHIQIYRGTQTEEPVEDTSLVQLSITQ